MSSGDGKIDGATNGSGAPTANQLRGCLGDLQMEPPKAEAWTTRGSLINLPVIMILFSFFFKEAVLVT